METSNIIYLTNTTDVPEADNEMQEKLRVYWNTSNETE